MVYLLQFFLACAITLISIPYVIRIGSRFIMDRPDHRKHHKIPTPRAGGIVLYLLIILFGIFEASVRMLLVPITITFILGLYDDIINLRASYKLLLQLMAAVTVYLMGIKIDFIFLGHYHMGLSSLSALLTILYLVGTMNAFNLIDGMDGLASTLACISVTALLIISIIFGQLTYVPILLVMIGFLLSFLAFNIHPAKIFLGDSGSLVLGLVVGILSITVVYSAEYPQILGIFFIAFIPNVDTLWTIVRRLLKRKNIFSADRGHIHHQFLDAGFSYAASYVLITCFALSMAVIGTLTVIYPYTLMIIGALLQMMFISYFAYHSTHIFKLFQWILQKLDKKTRDISSLSSDDLIMKKYSIAQISATDFSVSKHLMPLIRHLQESLFEVTVLCPDGVYVEEIKKAKINYRLVYMTRSLNPVAIVKSILSVYKVLKGGGFTMVHVHHPIASVVGRIAAKLCKIPIVIYTAHGYYFHNNMGWTKRSLFTMIEKVMGNYFTDYLFTQSREDLQTTVDKKIIHPGKACCIGNGVDVNRFDRNHLTEHKLLKTKMELGLDRDHRTICFIGRLIREKGIVELLTAFALIAKEIEDVKLLIVGDTLKSERDQQTLLLLQQIIAAENLENRIIMLGLRDDVEYILYHSDIFVLPSHREGMPRSIIEAMAMKVPVIATHIRGCKEEVVHGQTGYLFEVGDHHQLYIYMKMLLSNQEERCLFGEEGRKKAIEEYDERKILALQTQIMGALLQARETDMSTSMSTDMSKGMSMGMSTVTGLSMSKQHTNTFMNTETAAAGDGADRSRSLVSVVIPTYKRSQSINTAVDSVLSQTYPEIEVIVVDDNPPDSEVRIQTQKAMEKYQGDPQVNYLCHLQNLNGAAARNTGIRAAAGKYIAFLDDDDEFLPDKIALQVARLEALDDSYGICYTKFVRKKRNKVLDRGIEDREGFLSTEILKASFFINAGSNILIKREIVEQIGGFDESFIRRQDLEFLIRASYITKIAHVDKVCLVINKDDASNRLTSGRLEQNMHFFLQSFAQNIQKLAPEDQKKIIQSQQLFLVRNHLMRLHVRVVYRICRENEISIWTILRYVFYMIKRLLLKQCYGFNI